MIWFRYLKEYLATYDKAIADVVVINGPNRAGDTAFFG
jgi:hypothetical protein